MAGQVIMQGFVGFSIPLWLRRLVTMVPTFVVIAIGVNVTQALVMSQVVLSLVLPVPVISLLILTRRRSIMGALVNRPLTSLLGAAAAVVIICLNVALLLLTAGVSLPLIP
jgi:manganese transport protein